MRFEKVWVEQCKATRAIRRRFGAASARDYLITPGSGIGEAPFDYARKPELGSICLVRSALSSLQAAFPT